MHNKAKNPKPYGTDENGNVVEWFTKEFNGGYGYEGYILESLVVVFSLSWVLLRQVEKMEGALIKRVLGYTLLAAMMYLYNCIIHIIKIKMPWYNPKFEIPDHYVKGPISVDQGLVIGGR